MLEDEDSMTWPDNDIRPDSRHSNTSHASRLNTTGYMQPALADIAEHQALHQHYPSMPSQKFIPQSNGVVPELRRTLSSPNPLSIASANVQPGYFSHQPQPARNNPNYPRPRPLNLSRSNSRTSLGGADMPMMSPASGAEYKPLMIGSEEDVKTFLETRFRQLQQLCCKIVAKAWIKVIEPKKQTRYPYNRGEESKPEWWPDDVRHKEPDHLMKPGILQSDMSNLERISLLMTLLRCQRVPVERLQLATAEVAAFIPADKTHLLREIYRVGREEERYRLGEIPATAKVYVASSAELSPHGSDEVPSPIYPEPVRNGSQSSVGGVSQLGIPQMQRPPSRPRSAQPAFSVEDLNNNPFNQSALPPAKRQKTASPQGPPSQHVMNYPMYDQQYYPFPVTGQQPQQHALTHSQSQLLYPTHNRNHLNYQQEVKSAPPGQQQFYVFPPDFPSPPPSGGFHTTFPHDATQPTSHAPQNPGNTTPSAAGPHTFGAAYVAAQQLSSLRETSNLQPPQAVPDPQPTPQHAATSNHFLATRSSPFLPTPLRAAGIPGSAMSTTGPNVSFSEFLNSPMTAGPAPASDGAVSRNRRGEKRPASEESDLESSDDEGTIEGDDPSPTKKV
jgi:hypothetical protein